MLAMRTTVTIDADVEAMLAAYMKRQGASFKEALNAALRRGLGSAGSEPRGRLELPGVAMDLRPGINLDKAIQLAGDLEDEELLRRMQVGK